MKNLKNYWKILPFVLLIMFTSCKKSANDGDLKKEEETDANLDLTKYYIIGRVPTPLSGGKTIQKPYVITFDEYGMAHLLREQEKKFTYENGKLTIGGNLMVFTIKDKQVIQYEDGIKRYPFSSYSLKKIPETNQFYNHTYQGNLADKPKTAAKFKFNAKTCEINMGPKFSFSGDYVLWANVACTTRSYATYEDNYTECTFVLIDDKLEALIAKPNLVDPQIENYTYGILNKVN